MCIRDRGRLSAQFHHASGAAPAFFVSDPQGIAFCGQMHSDSNGLRGGENGAELYANLKLCEIASVQ